MARWIPQPTRRMAWHGMALMLLAGCAPATGARVSEHETAEPPRVAPLIDAEARTHHFGAVLARPGRKLVHRYPLRNAAEHVVTIVDIVNRKPCCGALAIGKTTLAPGESTEVELTLSVGDKFGDVVHEAVVVIDPPAPEDLVLRTTAQAIPALRVEPVGGRVVSLIRGATPQDVEYRVFAHGTPDEPPIDLDTLALVGTAPARWLEPKQDGAGENGLSGHVRRFAVTLRPEGDAGERRDSVGLKRDDQVVLEEVVTWQVVAPIAATPRVLVLRPGVPDYRVLLRSSDDAPFRVTGFEGLDPAIEAHGISDRAASEQVVTFRVASPPRWDGGKGTVTVRTDHSAEPAVEIPVVVLE